MTTVNQALVVNGLKPLVVLVLGGPCSGKSTACERILQDYSYKHLSLNKLLAAEKDSDGSKYGGDVIEKYIQDDKLVPAEVICAFLEKAMVEHCRQVRLTATTVEEKGDAFNKGKITRGKFTIEGFPRNEEDLQVWTKQLADKVSLATVIFLDNPGRNLVQRCLDRDDPGTKVAVGMYIEFCGDLRTSKLEQSLWDRVLTYRKEIRPVIDYYRKQESLKTINVEGEFPLIVKTSCLFITLDNLVDVFDRSKW